MQLNRFLQPPIHCCTGVRTTKIKPLNDNLSQRKYIVFAWKDHTMKMG